jgi:hypothetical protein
VETDGRDQYLEEDTGRLEGDFDLLGGVVLPVKDLLDVLSRDLEIVAVSDGRLEKDPDGVGKTIW